MDTIFAWHWPPARCYRHSSSHRGKAHDAGRRAAGPLTRRAVRDRVLLATGYSTAADHSFRPLAISTGDDSWNHIHGGRAVADAFLDALASLKVCALANRRIFTRLALDTGFDLKKRRIADPSGA